MKDPFGNYYNRVQIYLDKETFRKFEQLCLDKGSPKSKVGGWIFTEYFKSFESQPSQTNSECDRTESLQSQIDELRKMINRLEDKFDSSLDAELEITRTDSVRDPQEFKNLIPETYYLKTKESFLEESPNSKDSSIENDRDKVQLESTLSPRSEEDPSLYNKVDAGEDNKIGEIAPSPPTKNPGYKVPRQESQGKKSKPYIPKDIQQLNENGGIKITDGKNINDKVLDTFFSPLLESRHILKTLQDEFPPSWVGGGRHPKISRSPVEAKLYHSASRMKIAIPKLEDKFKTKITPVPAMDYLREFSVEVRAEIILNWGIEYSFVEKINHDESE